MSEDLLDSWLPLSCLLGSGVSLLGALALLLSRPRSTARPGYALVAGLGLVALCLASAWQKGMAVIWAPGLVLGCLWVVGSASRMTWGQWLGAAFAGLMRQPRFQGAVLLTLTVGMLVAQVSLLDSNASSVMVEFAPQDEASDPFKTLELEALAGQWCLTDAGQRIPLCAVTASERARLAPIDEDRYLQGRQLSSKVIRTSEQSLEYNCHGWVFTGGKHWVRGMYVEQILQDNAYQQVYRPQSGDVAVWRDSAGKVVHTGLVHSVSPEGQVLVESKWGIMGRYIHTPNGHCYLLTTCTYYHSPRGGHLLRGLDGSGPATEPPPVPRPDTVIVG